MRRNNANASKGNLYLFRVVCVVFALTLFISAIAFSTHHLGGAGLICLLFAFIFILMMFVQHSPGAAWWLGLFGLVIVLLVLLVALI